MEGESHVGRHRRVKEPRVGGGGGRVRNSARGEEAENAGRAITERFFQEKQERARL